jgi:tRNA-2-methylthio-N6-dimethylallyladenosine synthase
VRGPEASRAATEILTEVAHLAAEGAREITFLGQNVNAYGKEPGFEGRERFVDLLRDACGVSRVDRVRFMTSHPKDMSDDLIALLAGQNQVCEHLHLPVQSGSDAILAAMHRGYDSGAYVDLVRRLRTAVPDLALTTDLIVGFPGETESDFLNTLSLVEMRRQTEAARLSGRVDAEVAQDRMARLVDLVQRLGRERNQAMLGVAVEVMVERISRQSEGEVMGRTRGHKPVNFVSAALPGQLVWVELLEATSTSFRGREVERRDRQ